MLVTFPTNEPPYRTTCARLLLANAHSMSGSCVAIMYIAFSRPLALQAGLSLSPASHEPLSVAALLFALPSYGSPPECLSLPVTDTRPRTPHTWPKS